MKKFKKLKQCFCSLTFHSPNGDVEFSANWDNEKECFYFPCLRIEEIKFEADNPDWLFGEFYEALKKYTKYRHTTFTELDKEFCKWITKDKADDILEILKASKELNWHK